MSRHSSIPCLLACLLFLAACGRKEDPTIAKPIDFTNDGRILAVERCDPASLPAGSEQVENRHPETGLLIARGWICSGKRVGPWVYYHADGKTPWQVGTFLIGGIQDGEWSSFHPNGRPASTITYDKGVREGLARTWHENGRRETRGVYHLDRRVGHWRRWHENGRLECTGAFRKGDRWGLWTYYDARGAEVGRQNYNQPGDAVFSKTAKANEKTDDTIIPDGRK